MEKEIKIKPIGIIHTPYKEPKGIPIQGKFEKGITGRLELFPEYQDGLKDVEGFSHIILIYYFDRSKKEELVGKPFLEDETHGIFAIRSPHRPNHIGLSIVKIERVEKNVGWAAFFCPSKILEQGEILLQSGQLQRGEFDQWREMNKAFHLAILLETHNDLLIRFAKLSRNIPIVFNGSFRWYSLREFQRAHDHHQVIYDAMKNQQPERADFMMQEHVMHAAEILKKNYQD